MSEDGAEMDLSPADGDIQGAILDELKAIVTSILTGRIVPLTLTMLSLRYADVKGYAIPFRRLGCTSLTEVFQKYFANEIVCVYMHYYKDYVVWMKDDHLSRDTVIDRLRRYVACVRPTAPNCRRTPVSKTPFKRTQNTSRLLSSRSSSVAFGLHPSSKPLTTIAAINHDQSVRSPVNEDPVSDLSCLIAPRQVAAAAAPLQMVRAMKRTLSNAESSLILPVQRMRIACNGDPNCDHSVAEGVRHSADQ